MNTSEWTIERQVHFRDGGFGRGKKAHEGPAPVQVAKGRVPRIAKLMALAIRFEELVRTGAVANYAELARLGHVTRARVTQIMNLIHLAPHIQEALLFLPRTERGRDCIQLRQLQRIAMKADWHDQRHMWQQLEMQSY